MAGFGALNDFDANFQEFQTRKQQQLQEFQARQQQQYNDFQSRTQQEIAQFRKRSDDKIAEIKRKSAETFEKLEKEYNDFIQGTPFVNCIPGWSFLECKQSEPAWWSCNLKPGITRSQMQSDVEAYCTQKSDAFEYDPLDDFEEPENEENDTPIRMNAQVEELSEADGVTAYAEFDPSQDSQDAPYATQQNNSWNTNYNDSDKTPDSAPAPTQDKSASTMIAQDATRKAEKNKKNCTPAQRNKINATDCKISPDGKYSDIKCDNQKGYRLNANSTACEKSSRQETNKKCTQEQLTQLNAQSGKLYYYAETPNTQYCGITQCKNNFVINNDKPQEKCVCPTEKGFEEKEGKCVKKNDTNTINIIGTVVDGDSTNKQPIKWVYIKYDEGKKNPGQMRTGGNGKFNIDVIPGTTVTFEHTDYKTQTATFDIKTESIEIQMTHKSLAAQHGAAVGEPCPDDVLKILNAESGTYKKDATTGLIYCNIKKCTSNLKITKTEKPEPINFTDLDIMLEHCECPDNLPVKRSQNGVLECIPAELIHISGYVTNYKNEALPGVKIKIDKKTIKTDPSGHFTLSAQIGAKILLSHKGYKDYTHTIWADNTNPTIVMIEANAKNIQRGGNVIDEKGNPMPNITIKYDNKKIQTDKDGRFDITAPQGTVMTLSAKGYEDIQITLDEDCPDCDIDMTPTKKQVNNTEKKKLCEKEGPNTGKWNETLKTCNCKGKAFFDETDGCTTATTEYTNAESALETLYEQFTAQLNDIKSNIQQQ